MIMSLFKKVSTAVGVFTYLMVAASPVMADDSEIYAGGTGGSSGNPNVMLLIDTSGSMAYSMYTTGSTSVEADKRYTHLKDATSNILGSLPGNINVGLARYNSDTNGGRIIYPLTALNTVASARPDGSQDRNFAINTASDDVVQTSALPGSLLPGGSTLTVGGTNLIVTMAAATDSSEQCSSDIATTTAAAQTLYLGGARKGLYLNNYPDATLPSGGRANRVNCQSNVGLRFSGITLPAGAVINSANLVLTHAADTNGPPSTWGTTSTLSPDDDGGNSNQNNNSLPLQISLQNVAAPVTYTAASPNRLNDRSYYAASPAPVQVSIPYQVFAADGETLTVDVTSLAQARLVAGATSAIALRIEGRDGNSQSRAPDLRRIYGFNDPASTALAAQGFTSTTLGPRLEITYSVPLAAPSSQNTIGVRFTGIDIPQGATINSAFLQFTAKNTNTTPTTLQVDLDNANSSAAFAASTGNDLWSTPRWSTFTGSSVTYAAPAWTKDSSYQIDVKTLVAARVSQAAPTSSTAGYCGSDLVTGGGNPNAIAFRVSVPTGSTIGRSAYSFESAVASGTNSAPRLIVNFTSPTGASCVQVRRLFSIASSTDDAAQTGTAVNTLTDSVVTLGSNNAVGLRFTNIGIKPATQIVDARLTLKASSTQTLTASNAIININSAATIDLPTFNNLTSGKISGMTLATGPVAWDTRPTWSSPTAYSSPNVASIVQTAVNNASWGTGSAMDFILKGTGSSGPQMIMYDQSNTSTNGAQLAIIYQSSDPIDAAYTARQALIDTINGLSFTGGTPLNESYYEVSRYMLGQTAQYDHAYTPLYNSGYSLYPETAPAMSTSNVFQSPTVGQASCQSNNIIALTDGLPTNDSDQVSQGTLCAAPVNVGTVDGQANIINSFTCMANTASYLNNTGKPSSSGGSNSSVKTYTVGFGPVTSNPSGMAAVGLNAVAVAGGGQFFSAADSTALAADFQTIFARISDSNGTMASPGVAVNQLNGVENLDQLYYGVFKPKNLKRWPGNLKRYRFDSVLGQVVDFNGASAIDPQTQYFNVNALSWWSDPNDVDGNNAQKGGAARMQNSAIPVYTDNSSGVLGLINSATPPAGMSTSDVQWIQGYDVDNENGQGVTGFRQALGAPIHPQPTLYSYAVDGSQNVVFIGTNDGLLHSINTSNGTENWAFLPSDLQANIAALRANTGLAAGSPPIYGLDGTWTVDKLSSGKTLLVGGMRQGGSNYYAIEIPTTPGGAPKLAWSIRQSTATAGSPFSYLGYTWSQPVATNIRIGTTIKDVLVFGGGLDYGKYESGGAGQLASPSTGDKGGAVYMVDAATGSLIWWASSAVATTTTVPTYATNAPGLKYSVTGSVKVVDKDGDGLADHLYFADLGGQVFRADIDNRTTAVKPVKRVALLATLGGSESGATGKPNDRRFYERPSVEYNQDSAKKLYAAVAIGSGNRDFPNSDTTTQDRFFLIKDYDAARFDILDDLKISDAGLGLGSFPVANLATYPNPLGTSSLADVTSIFSATAQTAVDAKKGWYINLGAKEKVLSSPLIFSRYDPIANKLIYQVFFNTYMPDISSSAACSAVSGATTAYDVLVNNGTAGVDRNADGLLTASDRYSAGTIAGITGSGVALIRNGKLSVLNGTGTQEPPGLLPPGFGHMQRTRWYDKRGN
jgi:type IV pilus assembly protein PilY1